MAAPERLHLQMAAQNQDVPLHSVSVPSTPHQQPRDLRFPSRSPSPGRPIASRSTQPVVTQPSDHAAGMPQQSAPVVCKFESGAEFRKRRIGYKDGGNEPLPPPKKEPRKTLDPAEEDKLSGDMRELYDRILPSEESEKRRAQLVDKLQRILNEEWPGHDIKVNVFGSSGNLLSSCDSDGELFCLLGRVYSDTYEQQWTSVLLLLSKSSRRCTVSPLSYTNVGTLVTTWTKL